VTLEFDIYHFRLSDVLIFLRVSKRDFKRKEGILFPELPRNATGHRYADIYTLCRVYAAIWDKKPTLTYVADFLTDSGLRSKEWFDIYAVRLESLELLSQ
jgi:hypothetical protein